MDTAERSVLREPAVGAGTGEYHQEHEKASIDVERAAVVGMNNSVICVSGL